MQISITDINKRTRMKDKKSSTLVNMREAQIYTADKVFCKENAINSIKNWESLGNNLYESYLEALNIFDSICENCNEPIIKTCAGILVEAVSKVRDQTQLANSLKYRMARFKKNKTTKITKVYNDVSEKIKNALTVKPIAKAATVTSAPAQNNNDAGSTDGVASECYNMIYEECLKNKECDRIINTYNNISKRFNIDKIISEVTTNDELYEYCATVAKYVDTYNSPFKNRYNTALEVASYSIDKYYLDFPKSKIIEAVTDYFIFSGVLKEAQINDVKSVRDISVLFEQSDFSSLSWLLDQDTIIVQPEEDDDIDPYIYESYGVPSYLYENKTAKEVKDAGKNLVKNVLKGNPDERKDQEVKQMINDFRKNCVKDPNNKTITSNLKSLLYKIFTHSPDQIINELPNLFVIFRILFISTTAIIQPIIALLVMIINQILKLHLERKQLDKAIKAYDKEIKTIKDKIEKAKDGKHKERLEKYLEELKKDKEKLEYHERDLYTDEENDKRDEEKYASEIEDDDDDSWDIDDDWGDDDGWGDLDLDESAIIRPKKSKINLKEISEAILMSNMVESISEAVIDDTVDGIVCNNIFKLDDESIDAVTDFSITVPVILEKQQLREALINYRNDLRKSAKFTKDYIRIDTLNENIYKIENSNMLYNTSNSNRDILNYLLCLKEFTKMNSEYITEMEFGNTIKMAINKLQKDAVKLTDKEKKVSSAIDVAANNVASKLQDNMRTNSREAVIRGSIIPSTSKCIKLALLYGAEWCISPAIAVITAVGNFACAKSMQKKERQLVLDDIEIELKMCERYLRAAEDKGDLKKVREIEKIKRNLIRQKQRLTYKMVTVYHQPIVKAKDDGNTDDD